jgi:hypothetical protein
MKLKRQTMLKRSKRKGSKKRTTKRAKVSRSYKKEGGGAPASYVGSIQGNFINDRGQQLFRNPVRGIA